MLLSEAGGETVRLILATFSENIQRNQPEDERVRRAERVCSSYLLGTFKKTEHEVQKLVFYFLTNRIFKVIFRKRCRTSLFPMI